MCHLGVLNSDGTESATVDFPWSCTNPVPGTLGDRHALTYRASGTVTFALDDGAATREVRADALPPATGLMAARSLPDALRIAYVDDGGEVVTARWDGTDVTRTPLTGTNATRMIDIIALPTASGVVWQNGASVWFASVCE